MTADDDLIHWLQKNEYKSQGREHVNVFFDQLLEDLLDESKLIRSAATNGELVYTRNYSLSGPAFLGDVDLVVGPPKKGYQAQLAQKPSVIIEDDVDDIWLAVDFEALMSSVQNNWKNRGREIHSFYMEVYTKHPIAVTAAVMLFNDGDVDGSSRAILESYSEFEFGEGGLKQQLDAMSVIPISNGEDFDRVDIEEPILSYSHLLEVLVKGLEDRLKGDLDITPETLDSLTAYDESERLEFKVRIPDHAEKLAKDAVALANNEGGRIVLGVEDVTKEIVGLDNLGKTEERVANLLDQRVDTDIVDEISTAMVDGKGIIEIRVKRMKHAPASMDGTFYVRSGTTRKKLGGQEIVDMFPRT